MAEEHIEVFREQVKKSLDDGREINFNYNSKKITFPCNNRESVKIVFEEFIRDAVCDIKIICNTFPDDFYIDANEACEILKDVVWHVEEFKIVCVKNNLPKKFSSIYKENIIELPNGISILDKNNLSVLLVDYNFLISSSAMHNDYIASIDGTQQIIQKIEKLVDSFFTNFKKEQN